ncbi:hypothetical protein M8J76_013498 [Diaphorina citri]|nr:hypothetical protein M8J75_007033 [Diaphorina citri]KAI5714237.1 hypothetical protein M8J76_013498 [Diaphorina citri]
MNPKTFQHILLCVAINLALVCLASGKNINLATDNDIVNSNKLSDDKSSGFIVGNEIKVLYKLYEQCRLTNKDLVLCLKLKLINAIDKLNNNKNIEVLRGIYLVKDSSDEVANSTGASGADEQRSAGSVDSAINEKIYDFFKSRSLSLKLFELDNQEDADNQVSERKKKDKGSGWMLWPFLMGGMMIPLSFMALALLAGKALILAKLALALSAIIALKKLSSHGGGGGSGHDSYQVVSHGAGTHYRRSLPMEDLQAQNLAYRAYLADVTELSSPDKTE